MSDVHTNPKPVFPRSRQSCDFGCGRPGVELVGEKGGSVLLACGACTQTLIEPCEPRPAARPAAEDRSGAAVPVSVLLVIGCLVAVGWVTLPVAAALVVALATGVVMVAGRKRLPTRA